MNLEDVQEIVDRELGPLARKLGVGHARIVVKYKSDPKPVGTDRMTAAYCARAANLGAAEITFYHERIENGEELRKYLLHEMLHVVMTPSGELGASLKRTLPCSEMVEYLRSHTEEKLVCNLIRIYDNLSKRHPGPDEDRPIATIDAQEYLKAVAPAMLDLFGINHYRVSIERPLTGPPVDYSSDRDNRSEGKVFCNYETATLRFNHEALTTTRMLSEALRRELFKIVLEPYLVFTGSIGKIYGGAAAAADFFKSICDVTQARLVRALEAMYDGMAP